MAIQRSGPTPAYLEYIIGFALLPRHASPTQQLLSIVAPSFEWIDIPSYQRGIAWTVPQVEELLASSSVLLGNVILGQFQVPASGSPVFPKGVRTYSLLVDGLQRFSIGTMLLALLYPRVLADTPLQAAEAGRYGALAARAKAMAPVFQHNDVELANHPRQAVADAYRALRGAVERYLDEQFTLGNGEALAKSIEGLYIRKQVAVDIYFNFASAIELTNTFIGINTVRVDLGPVDLLRSYIVDRALLAGWSPSDIEAMENRFTEVFTSAEKPISELLPFVAIVLQKITTPGEEPLIFPSWPVGLTLTEVDNFLDFVARMCEPTDNGYVMELRETGAIPFAGVLCHFYQRFLAAGQMPHFLSKGNQDDADLHKYLCANYRALLAGQLGRSRVFAEMLLRPTDTLGKVADLLSQWAVKTSINSPVDPVWLRGTIRRLDKLRAPRVFNAIRLPPRSATWGTRFAPDIYGSKSQHLHIDHLFPASVVERDLPGAMESDTLVNLSPLPANQNRVAKATSCSSKLGPGGIYAAYVASHLSPHPYAMWLLQAQGDMGADLDRQELLEPNQEPDVVSPRIEWLSTNLHARL